MSRPRHNPELAKSVGRRIKNLRRNRGLTLEQVAERLDSQVGYLCDLEAGRKVASLPMLADLAKCLGVEVFALFVEPGQDDRHALADVAATGATDAVKAALDRQ